VGASVGVGRGDEMRCKLEEGEKKKKKKSAAAKENGVQDRIK
jgi:hypothetical protein